MALCIAQLTDVHISNTRPECAANLAEAVATIVAMRRQPDLVLVTGDLTDLNIDSEYDDLCRLLAPLPMPWEAIRGNHDTRLQHLVGHRAVTLEPLCVLLMDSANERFTEGDADWLDRHLASCDRPTVIAIHHPPFETGVWWMDCIGLRGADLFEQVVRRNPHVAKVLSGHVHRPVQTSWGPTQLWVGPSTAVQNAPTLDRADLPAVSAEPPAFSVHLWNGSTFVSHVVPVGPSAATRPLSDLIADYAPFDRQLAKLDASRASLFR